MRAEVLMRFGKLSTRHLHSVLIGFAFERPSFSFGPINHNAPESRISSHSVRLLCCR